MTSVGRIAVIGLLALPCVPAQAQNGAPPIFEVASVKSSASGDRPNPSRSFLPGGRFTATDLTVRDLLLIAYDIPRILVSGGPGWIDSTKYNIDAKAENQNARSGELKRMLQALLADRFKLVLRRETKELPVYTLMASKNGPKLKKAEERACSEVVGFSAIANGTLCHYFLGGQSAGLTGYTVNMQDLADALTLRLERVVLDTTGITGTFDIKTSPWTSITVGGREPASDANGASLFAVLEEQLGLKLESGKAPVETLVVEHVEAPSGN